MFIVSHDRYFINRMADKVIRLTPDGCMTVPGNYDAYLERMEKLEAAEAEEAAEARPAKENAYKQRKEQESAKRKLAGRIRRTEEEIAAAEEAVAALHLRLESEEVTADYERLLEVTGQLEAESRRLDELMEQWEQLQLEAEA